MSMRQRLIQAAFSAAALGTLTGTAHAKVVLPRLFSDSCVLQAAQPIPVFGTADPGEKITVTFKKQTATTTADEAGNWSVKLKAEPASETPNTLTVAGAGNTITLKDVLMGEVWICSGQSNMEWTLANAANGGEEVKQANDPLLRMFTVPKRVSLTPQTDIDGGTWQSAAPSTAGGFSAVGYYFAQALRKARRVPIGMIHTSWGGTPIQAWMSKQTLIDAGIPKEQIAVLQDPTDPTEKAKVDAAKVRYDAKMAVYKAAGSPQGSFNDPGMKGSAAEWSSDASQWGAITVPGFWEKSGVDELEAVDGGVWFRKTVVVAATDAGKSAKLSLGAIDDYDTTFVNNVKVGATGAETEGSWAVKRSYTIPAGVLKAGENIIAVRVWDGAGDGGFGGTPDEIKLMIDNGAAVPLAGEWQYKIENVRPSMPSPPSQVNQNTPTVLYNGMLAPLAPYNVRGFLWYQGESNAFEPETTRYRTYLPAMVQNWRTDFQNANTPFLIVQLAPYKADKAENTDWAFFREAQLDAAAHTPLAGVAVITDAGDVNDIHPRRKQPVGERLAILARRIAYKEKVVSSPMVKNWEREAHAMRITFADAGKGLTIPAEARGVLTGWEIAGGDNIYHPAIAKIDAKHKEQVIVFSPEVPYPFHVRYGWRNVPDGNLFNSEGLPTSPFRTDVPLIPVPGK